MPVKTILAALAASAAALLLSPSAFADRHYYGNAYQYATQNQGELEGEYILQYRGADLSSSLGDVWKHELELEYGLTDHWDVALYQVFAQEGMEGLRYDGFKLETRYRLAERGDWPVDVLLYGEYELPSNFSREGNELEQKLVLARDFGKTNLALNLVAGQAWDREKRSLEPSWGYALGASYEITRSFRAGLELFSSWAKDRDSQALQASTWAGPTISLGIGDKLWWALGAAVGLSPRSEDLRVRSILGLYL